MAVTEGNKQLLFGTHYPFYSSELDRPLLMFHNKGKVKFASLDYYSKPVYVLDDMTNEAYRMAVEDYILENTGGI